MVYVDPLMNHGWYLSGRYVRSCHLFADSVEELHEMAQKIGLKRGWFQQGRIQHYDLVKSKRDLAVANGAQELTMREAVMKWRATVAWNHVSLRNTSKTQ